jgi:hypothetical protein
MRTALVNQEPLFALPKKRQRNQPKPSAEETAARELLTALWARCGPAVNHSMTQTEWRSRYKRSALDMVRAGVTIERALAAHAAVCLAVGHAVYSLRVIQDELMRIQARGLKNEMPNRVVLDDGWVIEGNPSDPAPLADTL